jgi:hypothetical protein
MQRRAELWAAGKASQEAKLFADLDEVTTNYGTKWQRRQELVAELRTVLAEVAGMEAEDVGCGRPS